MKLEICESKCERTKHFLIRLLDEVAVLLEELNISLSSINHSDNNMIILPLLSPLPPPMNRSLQ